MACAKGVKKITSRRQGALQTGNLIRGKIYEKAGFFTLGEVEIVFQPLAIRKSLVSCGMLLASCELTDRLLPQGQANYPVYLLFWETLLQLTKKPKVETMINFEVKLLQLLGYGIPRRAAIPLRRKEWRLAQAELWRYLNSISEGRLMGLTKILI